jgi:hypothetical protein
MPQAASTNPVPPDDSPRTSAQKTAATVQRHKQERRAERLSEISAQTADGTLIVRQMTASEHDAASEDAREVRERSDARRKGYRSPGERES